MAHRYTKLFESILESTIWCEPDYVRVVWITLLAMADKDGSVLASIPGLAKRANVTVDQARQAIACFLAPDPDSRTKDHEGRRVAVIDGGWKLLNHAKYRELLAADADRERKRRWWAENRGKGAKSTGLSTSSSVSSLDAPSGDSTKLAEASTEASTEVVKALPHTSDRPNGHTLPKGWWSSDEGILNAARLLQLAPRPGESFQSLKARIERKSEQTP
ncbi:MAG TPA: hypothetical protein VMU47_11015 [Caldimonas sp.]|nr:hypothetical protein [Caldimonas sp.]